MKIKCNKNAKYGRAHNPSFDIQFTKNKEVEVETEVGKLLLEEFPDDFKATTKGKKR